MADESLLEQAVAGNASAVTQVLRFCKREITAGQKCIREHQHKLATLQKAQQHRFDLLTENFHEMQGLLEQQMTVLGNQHSRLEAQNQHIETLLERSGSQLHTPKNTAPTPPLKSPKKRSSVATQPKKAREVKAKRAKVEMDCTPPDLVDICWDPARCGQLSSIAVGGRQVTTTGNGWNVVVADAVIDAFEVQLVFPKTKATNTIAIGFTAEPEFWREPTPKMQIFDFWKSGWYINVRRGTLCSRYGHDDASFASSFKSGDTLTVVFDRTLKTIRFLRNGSPLGIAYSDIEVSELYPALVSYDRGVGVNFVGHHC
ncbi:hypothetical protein ACHHYP_02334 [Achlya hypogyna]|uniref:SPRY domain-containing protein n=1 Tax=Achlya hypogyna TaxID=1202772 RepID=A0A1V9Z6Z0_ACHHY|nr:hypothetical protein ACHHYP_02334 [Achlya hypogyna]